MSDETSEATDSDEAATETVGAMAVGVPTDVAAAAGPGAVMPDATALAGLMLSSTEEVPGRTITAFLGVVAGSTVRAKNVGRDIMAGLKNLVGGELKGYTELLNEARQEAMQRMMLQAQALGANAIVGVRFTTSTVASGAAELFAYGTAVIVE